MGLEVQGLQGLGGLELGVESSTSSKAQFVNARN